MRNGFCFVMITLFSTVSGCASLGSSHQMNMPGPDATQLYTYITRDAPYSRWKLFPGKVPGVTSDGSLPATYVNRTAFKAIKKRKGIADGAIIVKENYLTTGAISTLTVMYKIRGYNPADGDWFWAKYKPDGSLLVSGKENACINCHRTRAADDYLFSGGAPESK